MKIGGFQKMSLIDFPATVASVVFTQGCVFRCAYCHNPELIDVKKAGAVPVEEILSYLDAKKHFIEGVCITGGEPTLQHDLSSFIKTIKNIGYKVKLDTNGVNPHVVKNLIDKNLVDYIAMDIKNVWEKYGSVMKLPSDAVLQNCKETFSLIQSSGVDHEFRTTIFPVVHTKEDFCTIAGYLRSGEKYFVQDIRYETTLDDLTRSPSPIDVLTLTQELQGEFPHLVIGAR